jgi:hypothetical protein
MPLLDPSQVVGDSADPARTLRPNLPSELETSNNYKPMLHPEFHHKIHLPEHVNPKDLLAIFDLFYSPEQLAILVDNTNAHGLY